MSTIKPYRATWPAEVRGSGGAVRSGAVGKRPPLISKWRVSEETSAIARGQGDGATGPGQHRWAAVPSGRPYLLGDAVVHSLGSLVHQTHGVLVAPAALVDVVRLAQLLAQAA